MFSFILEMTFLLIILTFTLLSTISARIEACPAIITREEWGAGPGSSSNLTTFPPTHVVIHHSATRTCTTMNDCKSLIKSFQNTHVNTNGWDDIGYNFLIGGDGLVYEGRGWGKTGTHTINYNSRSIGICLIGTFTSELPRTTALDAAKELIDCGVNITQISNPYILMGHRQASATECPGIALYNHVKNWPNWSPNP